MQNKTNGKMTAAERAELAEARKDGTTEYLLREFEKELADMPLLRREFEKVEQNKTNGSRKITQREQLYMLKGIVMRLLANEITLSEVQEWSWMHQTCGCLKGRSASKEELARSFRTR